MKDDILVTRPLLPSLDSYVDKLRVIWDGKWLTNNGPLLLELAGRLKERMKAEYLELFTNGHMALDIAIKALGLTGEVITTPYSFASTTHALVMNGLTPVFCDIREDDCNIDADKLEALITPRTSAILPVHVYGWPCDTEAIGRIARKHGLTVLYDAAHAFDVLVNGRPLVCEGDAAMISFHATKVYNTIEGGALVLHSAKIAEAAADLRNFGIKGPESVTGVGLNAKMNEFAAAMGLCNLELVDDAIARRRALTEQYISSLSGIKGLRLMDYGRAERESIRLNYGYMPVRVDPSLCGFNRDELFDFLGTRGIFARKYFYPLISDYECYRDRFDSSLTPVAKRVADSIITLPISASTTAQDVERVCGAIIELCKSKEA